MKLFLIQAVIQRWDKLDIEGADDETLEAIEDLLNKQTPTLAANGEVVARLNKTETALAAANYRIEVLESQREATATRTAKGKRGRPDRTPEQRAEVVARMNQVRSARSAQRWENLTAQAVQLLRDQHPIMLRHLATQILGRATNSKEESKLLNLLKGELGEQLELSGKGNSHDPQMLDLAIRETGLTISPELADRLEHSGKAMVVGDGIPEEEYAPEVKERIARMAALRPSAEERAKILLGGY